MAKRNNRTRVRPGGSGHRTRPTPGGQARRKRTPWYRKRETWGWTVALGALAGIMAFVVVKGDREESAPLGQPLVGGDLHSVVADPSDPSRLYVGGHEGVAVSTDGAATWRPIESLAGADAMGWAFNDDRVLVAGHPGLFVSTDGGRTFEMRNDRLPATDIHALGAGGGTIYGASPALGVFASTDGGRSWETRTKSAGQSFMGRILVNAEDPEHVIAPDLQFGAVESIDGGRTWRVLGSPGGAMWVTGDPARLDHLVVSGREGAAASADGGATWVPLKIPEGVTIIEMDAADPNTLYGAALQGTTAAVWVTHDSGATWSEAGEA